MTVYDEIEIEDLDFESDISTFFYNCPCGDRFQITLDDLMSGDDIAECPSCTLQIKIIFDREDLDDFSVMAKEAVLAM